MTYNPKLGAMSSPFGENPNEGSIVENRTEPVFKNPPEQSNEINGPSDIAKMMDEAYGGIVDKHNAAQDKIQTPPEKKSEPTITTAAKAETPKHVWDIDSKNEVIKQLMESGMKIKSIAENEIIAEVNGKEIKVTG